MSVKRKDNKGRVLRDNESQRSDGRYEFKFVDQKGGRHSVYSWRLVASDSTPQGKRRCEPLREIEKRVAEELKTPAKERDRADITLNELFDNYMSTKIEIKDTTRLNYLAIYQRYIREGIGNRKVSDIRFTDIKQLYTKLLLDTGIQAGTIQNVHTLLHPVFQHAVRDELITTNPTDGAIGDIKRAANWKHQKKRALTIPEQTAFINHIASRTKYARWLPLFTVLLGTGCRIGEAAGLRWQDCDFDKNIIRIDHALVRNKFDGEKTSFRIEIPKTKSGIRDIPMLSGVRDVLRREYARQRMVGFNQVELDGYSGFIFVSRQEKLLSSQSVNVVIRSICRDYNDQEKRMAEEENREPLLLPQFSVHTLRHTFCTRFCENETNLKVIQEIMGHANISITMDIYNEATAEKKIESFENLDGKIYIG